MSERAIAKTLTISTRDQLGRYLQREAEAKCRLQFERSVLHELVDDAYKLKARMPTEWNERAQKALRDIKD